MPLATPEGYVAHSVESIRGYAASHPAIRDRIGGDASSWRIEEVGDGNLNMVFILRGDGGGVAIKQALPYVRLVGESWPLPLSRAHYEHMALTREAALAPGLTPTVHHYDETLALIAMELLEPHIILRRGMIEGRVYPRFADDISTFLAHTLFHTSDLALPADEKKAMIAGFAGNTALCKITEDLIFTEPYMVAENNRWTAPHLDAMAASFRADAQLKLAVSRLKLKFMGEPQALLHGDLHTGSVMATESDTRVIDPEFAFVGPMGFDIGAMIANLLINYFAQDGHETAPGARDAYRAWVLETTAEVWKSFEAKFLALWRSDAARGDGYPPALFEDGPSAAAMETERGAYMARLFEDMLGFAAAKMIRRVLGLAHNIDLDWIEPPKRRAECEARCLMLARALMTAPRAHPSIDHVCTAAVRLRGWRPEFG